MNVGVHKSDIVDFVKNKWKYVVYIITVCIILTEEHLLLTNKNN